MDIMQNIKGTNIVALAILKLCTVIDFYVSCQEGVPPVLLSPSLQDSESQVRHAAARELRASAVS